MECVENILEIKCSEYFCEACGDCLRCYWEDPCPYAEDGKHVGSLEDGTTFTLGGLEEDKDD